jgi:hypothetical protein
MSTPDPPFVGVLLMPERARRSQRTSPVMLGDGRPVAAIRWYKMGLPRFDIVDSTQKWLLGSGGAKHMLSRRFAVRGPDDATILDLTQSLWGTAGRHTVALPDGKHLIAQGRWTYRRFEITDPTGGPVARITTTGKVFSSHPDSYRYEIMAPALSLIQAIGLAQCLREAAEFSRSS